MGYKIEKVINAPLCDVWNAWSTDAETKKWLAPKANVNFTEGGMYEFFWDENPELNSTLGCKMRKIDDQKQLTFEWQGKTEFLSMFKPPYGPTLIDVSFREIDQGNTVVVLEQRETREMKDWEEYDSWMSDAWEFALASLKDYLEK